MSKKIGIIVAMDSEVSLIISKFAYISSYTLVGSKFLVGKIGDADVVICKSGIGKVNAAIAVHNLILNEKPDCIINTGVAGSLDTRIMPKDIVIGTGVKYYDVWCGKPNSRGQVQGEPEWFPCIDLSTKGHGWSSIMRKYNSSRNYFSIHKGPMVSGDWFMESAADKLKALRACARAKAVDMESGAIAQVCSKFGVPFLPIRVISDVVGEKNHQEKYEEFWNEVTERSFDVLMQMVKDLCANDTAGAER